MDWISIARLATSSLALALALGGFLWGVLVYHRNMNAQLFIAYTKRYDEVMEAFSAACDGDCPTDLFVSPPPRSQRLTAAVVRYLNVCSQEFYLHRRRYLANDIWSIWEAEIERNLAGDLLQREWPALREEYASFSEFRAYVDGLQADKQSP